MPIKIVPKLGSSAKKVRTMVSDIKDATRKLGPHQDPKGKRSAKIRHMLDNPKKPSKKSKSPHSPGKKKRTLRDVLKPGRPGTPKTPGTTRRPKRQNPFGPNKKKK